MENERWTPQKLRHMATRADIGGSDPRFGEMLREIADEMSLLRDAILVMAGIISTMPGWDERHPLEVMREFYVED